MIGYPVTLARLGALVDAEKPGWRERAKALTDQFRGDGAYTETKKPIWSEVKPVYMRLQGDSKCAYCERKLEAVEKGKGEQDVDHFRPKKRVRRWRGSHALKKAGVAITAPAPDSPGYHLLPYHLFNYAAACKPCNSVLKKDWFPIAGSYTLHGEHPTDLTGELPYLIYPLGDIDADPESLIRFVGVSPRAVAAGGHDRNRALVTIEFFALDDETRKNLFRERAALIVTLFMLLEKFHGGGPAAERKEAGDLITGFTSPVSAHTNCARSFTRLYESSRADAVEIYQNAVEFICSRS